MSGRICIWVHVYLGFVVQKTPHIFILPLTFLSNNFCLSLFTIFIHFLCTPFSFHDNDQLLAALYIPGCHRECSAHVHYDNMKWLTSKSTQDIFSTQILCHMYILHLQFHSFLLKCKSLNDSRYYKDHLWQNYGILQRPLVKITIILHNSLIKILFKYSVYNTICGFSDLYSVEKVWTYT